MNRQRIWTHRIITAICFVFVIMVCVILPTLLPIPDELSEITENDSEISHSVEQSVEEGSPAAIDTSAVEIDMDEIYINELASIMDMGRKYPDPEKCVDTVWKEKDIIAYYGNHLVPPYIPADLSESPHNITQTVVLSDTGIVWEDTVRLDFYQEYNEDGSAKSGDDLYIPRGFYLNASKIGLLHEFSCINSENAVSISYIGKTAVSIGYCCMEYGPYDPDTQEPSGYYDRYVAQFTLNGIEYEIVCSRLELEEVTRIVGSIIYNENNITIHNKSYNY